MENIKQDLHELKIVTKQLLCINIGILKTLAAIAMSRAVADDEIIGYMEKAAEDATIVSTPK